MTDDNQEAAVSEEPGSSSGQADDLVAFADCELIAINEAATLVINRNNGNQQVMASQVVEALKTCTEFDTLQGHATNLADTRPELEGDRDMALSALEGLLAAGMLLRAEDVCARLAPDTPRQLPPTRVFIITCDRPAAVERLLESMLHNAKLSRHDALFLVDDSREAANRDANHEAVAKFNMRSAREMFYVSEEAQAELLSGLTNALPAHADGIRFLLDRSQWLGKKTYGRSRTLCLLLSVGYRAILMDDDIVCRAIMPPITEPGIGIGSGGMRKAAFFESEKALLECAPPAAFDPISGHAGLLGSPLGHALSSLNGKPLEYYDLHDTSAAMANVLSSESPILVTQSGSLGDTGSQNGHWAVYQSQDTIKRLLSAPHGMTEALQNRLAWLGGTRPNVYKMPFMSQLTGLDNSYLLPPYFPAFRGEDLLFGGMLAAMHRDSVALEYPFNVPHLPMEERKVNLETSMEAKGGMSLIVRYLTEHIDYRDDNDPEYNLGLLAGEALRLSTRPANELLLDYRAELARGHADQLHLLQSQYAQSQQLDEPAWQAYLKRGVEEVQQALAEPHSPTDMSGVPPEASALELIADFQRMAKGFAEALSAWVEMRRVASELAQEMISSKKILPL
jgi:hypothetical protein